MPEYVPPIEFSPEYVRKKAIEQLYVIAERINARNAAIYLQHYEDVKLNWERKGTKLPHYDPPPLVTVDEESLSIVVSDKPVVAKRPDPWTIVPAEGDARAGVGVRLADGVYSVTPGAARVGERREIDGEEYELVEVGQPGTVIYRRLWVRVGRSL